MGNREQGNYLLFPTPYNGELFPLSMQHKTGPEVGRRPAFLSGQFKLSRSQSRSSRHTVFEHALIKKLHQFGRRKIVDIPQTRDHARRAGVHKSARQPDQPLISLPSPVSHALSTIRSALSWRL